MTQNLSMPHVSLSLTHTPRPTHPHTHSLTITGTPPLSFLSTLTQAIHHPFFTVTHSRILTRLIFAHIHITQEKEHVSDFSENLI